MTAARRALGGIRALVVAVVSPFVPEPGTTEGAVMLGLVFLAGGFLVAERLQSFLYAPLALLVPGAILVLIGTAPVIAALVRRS